jgi:hypothetical protein
LIGKACGVEADHGKLKQLIRLVRGFKSMKTAYATIKGFEVMRALRKGQAAIFNLTHDIVGEARLVERAFGLGPCALSEAVQLVGQRLEARKRHHGLAQEHHPLQPEVCNRPSMSTRSTLLPFRARPAAREILDEVSAFL